MPIAFMNGGTTPARVQVCNRSAGLTTKPEPNVLYFQSSLLLAEQMTNKFQIPNRDFVIWVLEFYHSTWPHYPHKLMGSGCKPEPAWSRVMFALNSYEKTVEHAIVP